MRSRAVRRVQWRLENGPLLYQNFSKEQAILSATTGAGLDQGTVQRSVVAKESQVCFKKDSSCFG